MQRETKARLILFDAYWSAKGWKHPRDEPSSEDFEYAKACGFMFDGEVLTHRSAIRRILRARTRASLEGVAHAFLASLADRLVHLRPALASFFAVRSVEKHRFSGSAHCNICHQLRRWDHDFSSTNFARLKWGFVPRFFLVDHAFILERFQIEPLERPSDADREILRNMLTAAESLPPDAKARDLERAWRPVVPSSKQERDALIEILLICGVLVPTRVSPADIKGIPLKSNWTDAAALWRGDDGIDRERAKQLFGIGFQAVKAH